jgi:hypothetical protein
MVVVVDVTGTVVEDVVVAAGEHAVAVITRAVAAASRRMEPG